MSDSLYPRLSWADDVAEDNYPAAQDYVALRWAPERASEAVAALRKTSLIAGFQPSDILRAAQQEFLPMDSTGVMRELRQLIETGTISPILLVNLPEFVIIADGYHRTCLAYWLSPFNRVPCRMVTFTDPKGLASRWGLLDNERQQADLDAKAIAAPPDAPVREAEGLPPGRYGFVPDDGGVKPATLAGSTSTTGSGTVKLWKAPYWDEPEPDDEVGDEGQ